MVNQLDLEKEAKKNEAKTVKYALNAMANAMINLKKAGIMTEEEYEEMCRTHYTLTARALYEK